MVVEGEISREKQTLVQTKEVNWDPQSDVRTEGTPNLNCNPREEKGSDTRFGSDGAHGEKIGETMT